MVEHVQILEHHSLAHAGLDIPVTAAKLMVSIIFKNVLEVIYEQLELERECFHTLFSSVWISR
jgi:hypothetical protein